MAVAAGEAEAVREANFYKVGDTTPFGTVLGKNGFDWTIPELWERAKAKRDARAATRAAASGSQDNDDEPKPDVSAELERANEELEKAKAAADAALEAEKNKTKADCFKKNNSFKCFDLCCSSLLNCSGNTFTI